PPGGLVGLRHRQSRSKELCPVPPSRKSRVGVSSHISEYRQEGGLRLGSIPPGVPADLGIDYRVARRLPSARECLCHVLNAQHKPQQSHVQVLLTDAATRPLASS